MRWRARSAALVGYTDEFNSTKDKYMSQAHPEISLAHAISAQMMNLVKPLGTMAYATTIGIRARRYGSRTEIVSACLHLACTRLPRGGPSAGAGESVEYVKIYAALTASTQRQLSTELPWIRVSCAHETWNSDGVGGAVEGACDAVRSQAMRSGYDVSLDLFIQDVQLADVQDVLPASMLKHHGSYPTFDPAKSLAALSV